MTRCDCCACPLDVQACLDVLLEHQAFVLCTRAACKAIWEHLEPEVARLLFIAGRARALELNQEARAQAAPLAGTLTLALELFDRADRAIDGHAKVERWLNRSGEFHLGRTSVRFTSWLGLRTKRKRRDGARPGTYFEAYADGNTPDEALTNFINRLDIYAEAMRPRSSRKK